MENFAAAILSNSASDIPADRLQWLHIINFFFAINTFSALHAGCLRAAGAREGPGAAPPARVTYRCQREGGILIDWEDTS